MFEEIGQFYGESYGEELEDFASKELDRLDEWVFQRVEADRQRIGTAARGPRAVIFLHLLGLDSNGHAHRPASQEYLDNIASVDRGVERMVRFVEGLFPDGRTAYIFTADHGMSSKGSHGDGDPANTETPLVAWGSGVSGPELELEGGGADPLAPAMPDRLTAVVPSTLLWSHRTGRRLARKDVAQVDVAALMSALLGLPFPVNSVGVVPTAYLNTTAEHRAGLLLANAQQVLAQFLAKDGARRAASTFTYRPFSALAGHEAMVRGIRERIARGDHALAEAQARDLVALALDGLHYFQVYDRRYLLTVVSLGYLGLGAALAVRALLPGQPDTPLSRRRARGVRVATAAILAVLSLALAVEGSPWTYHLYSAMAALAWGEGVGVGLAQAHRIQTQAPRTSVGVALACALVLLEAVVLGLTRRWVFSALLLLSGAYHAFLAPEAVSGEARRFALTCVALAAFPVLPLDLGNVTALVVAGGALLAALPWLHRLMFAGSASADAVGRVVRAQAALVALATLVVVSTEASLSAKLGLPLPNQLASWLLSLSSLALVGLSPPEERLVSVALGCAAPYLTLSISYEPLFLGCLSLCLLSWGRLEAARLRAEGPGPLRDLRVAFSFLFFVNAAFFGTGNVASYSSFEISSVYRLITVFNPFLMGALLLSKVLLPFIPVGCSMQWAVKSGSFVYPFALTSAMWEVLSLHTLFNVKNTGSWMEIGMSISEFGICNAQVVFGALLLAITSPWTTDNNKQKEEK
jgi:phosphatidylinositol glycan class N